MNPRQDGREATQPPLPPPRPGSGRSFAMARLTRALRCLPIEAIEVHVAAAEETLRATNPKLAKTILGRPN